MLGKRQPRKSRLGKLFSPRFQTSPPQSRYPTSTNEAGSSRSSWQGQYTSSATRWVPILLEPPMTRLRRPHGPSVQSPLETYLREINETALLTADEEKQLAYRIDDGDTAARDRMVRANLRLVVNIARSYTGK